MKNSFDIGTTLSSFLNTNYHSSANPHDPFAVYGMAHICRCRRNWVYVQDPKSPHEPPTAKKGSPISGLL